MKRTTRNKNRFEIESSAFYDDTGIKYEEAYAHAPGVIDSVNHLLHLSPFGPVLDCGCGTGKPVAATIAAAGRKVYGLDFSAEMAALSAQQVPSGSFQHVNMLEYQPTVSFGAIVAMLSLFELSRSEITTMANKWIRWLKPGGMLLAGVFAAEDCRAEPHMFDADGMCATGLPFFFMHHETRMTLFTRAGWKGLFKDVGFDIVEDMSSLFKPAEDCGSEDEPYYFVFVRKPE